MGLSILMQNVALMAMSADLFDVPADARRTFVHVRAVLCQAGVADRLRRSRSPAPWRCSLMLKATYLGKAIRATVQDGEAAQLMGIPVPRIFLITFAAGSALVGLSACVMMPLFSVFPTVGLNFVLIAFVIVVLGGMGSIEGALLGGICIGIVQSLSSYYIAPAYGQMFFFILFLLVMIFRPGGPARPQGRGHYRHQRLSRHGRGAAHSQATPRRWRLMPERGTVSLFELALLAHLRRAGGRAPAAEYLQDVIIQTFLWAGSRSPGTSPAVMPG